MSLQNEITGFKSAGRSARVNDADPVKGPFQGGPGYTAEVKKQQEAWVRRMMKNRGMSREEALQYVDKELRKAGQKCYLTDAITGYSLKGHKGVIPSGGAEYVLIHNGNQVFGPASYSACEQKSMELSRGPQDKFRVEKTRAWDGGYKPCVKCSRETPVVKLNNGLCAKCVEKK